MKSICFFSSYFSGSEIPYYVKYYLEELSNYFDEIILLTNIKQISDFEIEYLSLHNIQLRLYHNEGMDFGMWYKAFNEFEIDYYNRIGLINDSCILFKSLKPFFDWANQSSFDYLGMVSTAKVSLHIQSYFIIINNAAIPFVRDYFKINGIQDGYKRIIHTYEIGLSTYLLENGLKIDGFFDYSDRTDVNPSFILADDLIKNGCPIIKKKIISHNYYLGDYLTWFRNNFNIDNHYYIELIKERNTKNSIINLDIVSKEVDPSQTRTYIKLYQIGLTLYKYLSRHSILRFLFHKLILLKRFLFTSKEKKDE